MQWLHQHQNGGGEEDMGGGQKSEKMHARKAHKN